MKVLRKIKLRLFKQILVEIVGHKTKLEAECIVVEVWECLSCHLCFNIHHRIKCVKYPTFSTHT